MSDLVENFHYQPNFINNLIKKYIGLTYSDYLVSLRVEHDKVMLETTDLPIYEIIWLVGYHNKGYFYKRFTEITGVSPARFRHNAAAK